MCKARAHHPVHYLQQKCVKNQIQRDLRYENGFCADVLFVISVFYPSQIEAVQWRQQREKIIRSETFHNAPCFSETGLSLCTPGCWTSYHLYFCFQKLLTQSPHICHSDHSLAKTPKHLAQNVNIQFVRNWVNISERKKFWPIYLDIAPITNKDAPLAQTQLASSLSRKMSNCQWWNNDHL